MKCTGGGGNITKQHHGLWQKAWTKQGAHSCAKALGHGWCGARRRSCGCRGDVLHKAAPAKLV